MALITIEWGDTPDVEWRDTSDVVWENTEIETAPSYRLMKNPLTNKYDLVVNNILALQANANEIDPTGGGVVGRIPIVINGVTRYLAYY